LAAFSVSSSYTQSIGLLGQGISPSQGRYLHIEQHKHRINAYTHPYLEWDSNPRSQCSCERRHFMPIDRAATLIGEGLLYVYALFAVALIQRYINRAAHIAPLYDWLVYSCCSHLEHRASVILRQSVGLLGRGISASRGRYLTQTQNKYKQTSIPCVGFEPTIPAFRRATTVHTLDRAATVIGILSSQKLNNRHSLCSSFNILRPISQTCT
jgi:hypothetical protein